MDRRLREGAHRDVPSEDGLPRARSGDLQAPLRSEPVAQLGVPRGGMPREFAPHLADRARPLGEHVVPVDRLEVHLLREEEVGVGKVGVAVDRPLEREPHGVFDEARLQVRVLDDEQLVGALQQLVDGRAHRVLDDLDEVLRIDLRLGADEQRSLAALVVRRERDELEDAVDVAIREPCLE